MAASAVRSPFCPTGVKSPRLEGLTRTLDTNLVVSRALVERVRAQAEGGEPLILEGLEEAGEQVVKGRSGKIPVFTLRQQRAA